MTTTFDKLAYVDALKSGGFTAEQARVHANALDNAMKDGLVTRQDLLATKIDLLKELEPIKTDMAVMKWGIGLILAVVIYPLLKGIM